MSTVFTGDIFADASPLVPLVLEFAVSSFAAYVPPVAVPVLVCFLPTSRGGLDESLPTFPSSTFNFVVIAALASGTTDLISGMTISNFFFLKICSKRSNSSSV